MQAAVAFSDAPDSFAAAVDAACEALAALAGRAPELALVFHTAEHDADQVRAGLRRALGGGVRLVGGHAVGTITSDDFGYGGHELALGLFAGVDPTICARAPLAGDEEAVGRALGVDLQAAGLSRTPLLLLYDAINRTPSGMQLNMATPLLRGLEASAGPLGPVVGAGLTGDMRGSATWQIIDDDVAQQNAIALSFGRDLQLHEVILHGCEPASDYKTVTRADGPAILELDHRPAVDVISELVGHAVPPTEFGFFVTLGVNLGDPWAAYDSSAYLNRLCLKVDRRRGGIILFESDIVEGTRVQLMHRRVDFDDIQPRIDSLFAGLGDRRPVFALYIDCAGRAAGYAGVDREDALLVQQAVADRVPLLGWYSGVEIGSVLGRPRALDWTGVFCLYSEAA